MRVPISWLREFVALPDDVQAIAERLAMLGFPVAGIEQRPMITGVVTGRIAALEKHPNADRLQVAQIDVGDRTLTIATAANNVAAGQTIAVATIGAALRGLKIERRTMRGIASEGMMISADELALPPEWFEDGILQLDASTPLGVDAVALFGLDTAVFDVEITANRPDAMSIIGLARELAASYDTPLKLPPVSNPARSSEISPPEVRIESGDCHRFVAQRFEGFQVAPAPAWMRVRLALAGQRPINNVVDISNYVMLETGQPLHFYDGAKLDGPLIVRAAREGERLVTLDGTTRTLSSQALVIADAAKPLGLAGIMGGASSEVVEHTNGIVLEAANFSGVRVRRTSTALALRTEASSRHEKSLAPALADIGAARAAELLIGMGARASAPRAFGDDLGTSRPIALRVADVERILGLAIPYERIANHLVSLGCTTDSEETATMRVTAPPWRTDLAVPVDLIEEVARIEGYDRIQSAVPSVAPHDISSAEFESESRAAHELAALGYLEVITYSLRAADDDQLLTRGGGSGIVPVAIRNPLSEEQRFLRYSLLPGLLRYLADYPAARTFEIGEVFTPADGDVVESTAMAFGFVVASQTIEQPWHDGAFLRIKGDAEALLHRLTGRQAVASLGTEFGFHPGKTARLSIDNRDVGALGCVDPRISMAFGVQGQAYLCLIAPAALPAYSVPRYRPPSKFPSTYRDLAVVVDGELPAARIQRAVGDALGSICTAIRVFDEYRGPQVPEAKKSVALRITLQSFDATLTDEEADAAIATAVDVLTREFGATVRA